MWVLRRLRDAGHEAFFAGGCVRDMLLGTQPADYDIATDATPDQVAAIFRRVIMVGAKFGVAIVMRQRRQVEVATFRSDLSYSDGRRPDGVRFSSPRQDALRRDFTINGMFYDPVAEKVIDYVGGQDDLAAGVIRTIGQPRKRFAEDYLRLIRAVRFATRLDFHVDKDTEAAIRRYAKKITVISGERIYDELAKMLAAPSAAVALRKLHDSGLAREILPELFQSDKTWPAAVEQVAAVAAKGDAVLAMGALLMNLPKTAISRIVRRWGASNEFKDTLGYLSVNRDGWRDAVEIPLCQFKRLMANSDWQRLRRLWTVRERIETGSCALSRRIARRAGQIAPVQIAPQPFVTGNDLKAMGLKEGRDIGRILRKLYDAQLNEELKSRKKALAAAAMLVNSHNRD